MGSDMVGMVLQRANGAGEGVGRWAVSWRSSRWSWLTKWRSDAVGSVRCLRSLWRTAASFPAAVGRGRAREGVLHAPLVVASREREVRGLGEAGIDGSVRALCVRANGVRADHGMDERRGRDAF